MGKPRRVELDKLDIALDIESGKVVVGVPDEEGIIESKNAKDITESFYGLMQSIASIQAAAVQKRMREQPKIIQASDSDVQKVVRNAGRG